MSREYIARRAQELKLVHLGVMLALPSLLDPSLPLLREDLQRMGAPPEGDYPVILNDVPGGPGLTYQAREIHTKVTKLRGDVLGEDLLSISMLLGATRIGDMIEQGGFKNPRVPLLEFARHFRNACAHGDRWHFLGKEPRYPAACRDLEIARTLQGKRATYETVNPRRYAEFLDDISNYFVPGLVPPPAS